VEKAGHGAMNTWGKKSLAERGSSDPRLNKIGDVVLQIKNHSVDKGHRGQQEQHHAFVNGHSKLDWPDGNHNAYPSKAQDVRTYPSPPAIEFDKNPDKMSHRELRSEVKMLRTMVKDQPLREEQLYLLGLHRGVAEMMDIKIRTGADWDRDGEILDNGFDDFFHVEINGD